MKYILVFAFFFYSNLVNGQVINEALNTTLQTIAKVDTLITPDEIYLRIETDEKDSSTKLDELEKNINQCLNSIGINTTKNLKTDNFSSYYQRKFILRKKIKKNRVYELKVENLELAIKAIVELNELDIGKINLQRVDYSKKNQLKLELRSKAIKLSKKQAQALVKPLNQKIGNAIQIVDVWEKDFINIQSVLAGGMTQERLKFKNEISSVQLDINDIRFNMKVLVIYELK